MKIFRYSFALAFLIATGCNTMERVKLIRAYENPSANSSPVDTTVTNVTANRDGSGRQATLLSAFYGLDDDLLFTSLQGILQIPEKILIRQQR